MTPTVTTPGRILGRLAVLLLLPLACENEVIQWKVQVAPTDERIYKLDDELGFENWHFGIVLTGHDARGGVDELVLTHTAAGKVVARETLTRQALQTYVDSTPNNNGDTIAFRNFHRQMPAALAVDTLEIRATLRGRTVASRAVPLVRFRQRQRFRLPVRGCWLVSSGHDFGVEHRRWYTRSHFAWDFVRVDAEGDPHRARPTPVLEDYYAFGQPVMAPARGRIVVAEDLHPDNPPGEVGERLRANYLIIDHGDGIFSKLAHLKNGSLVVRAGNRVERGQVLARIGNSGLSDAPHLHFHFQTLVVDDAGIVTEEAPLPVKVSDYSVTSNKGVRVWVALGRPRRGEFVCAD